MFRHGVEVVHHPPIHQREIPGVQRNVHVRDALQDPVEQRVGSAQHGAFLAVFAHAVDDVVAFAPLGEHLQDEFRRILQVGVDDRHDVAARMGQAGGHGRLVAEIPRKPQAGQTGIARAGFRQQFRRPVAAAVVHEQHVQRNRPLPDQGFDALQQERHHRLLVVAGHDETDFGNLFAFAVRHKPFQRGTVLLIFNIRPRAKSTRGPPARSTLPSASRP